MDKEIRIPILLDLYGNLLSETQRYYLDSYYNNDLSLSEISDNVGKSRQGICESIKRAELILIDTEEKLGFLKKTESLKKDFSQKKTDAFIISAAKIHVIHLPLWI